ncbi:MAG: hypothetical protein GY719_20000 [bacterium]|nr:hypothetical protein [bacterium]
MPAAGEGSLRFDRLSVEHGLSHSSVWIIHQDSRGFLWLGTQEGLNRYDGYGFEVYRHDPENPDSLSESEVVAIHEDSRENLWIGTRGGGLDRFVRAEERFEHFRHDPENPRSLNHDVVEQVLEDHTGELWLGTGDGLSRLDRASGTFTRYQDDSGEGEQAEGTGLSGRNVTGLSGRNVWVLYEDRDGTLWIGTDRGLNRYDRSTDGFTRFRHDPADPASLSSDSVGAIVEDSEGALWVGTGVGLDRLDRRSGTFTHYRHDSEDAASLGPGSVLALHEGRGGELWIGTHPGGLSRLAQGDRDAGRFLRDRHDPADPASLSSDSIYSIIEDATGIQWLGTRDGASRYDRLAERFVTTRARPGRGPALSSDRVRAILEDRSGTLWLGTHDGGLERLERVAPPVDEPGPTAPKSGSMRWGNVTHYRAGEGGLRHDTVTALSEDRSGALWIGTWGGLSRLDAARRRLVHYRHDPADPRSLPHDVVLCLREDSAGRLWVGTSQGLGHLEAAADLSNPDAARFVRYVGSGDASVPGPEIFRAITEDRSGAMWFGTLAAGLYRLGEDGRFVRFRHDSTDPASLGSDKIAALYEDRSGVLWVGTHGAGLHRLDRVEPASSPARARFTRFRQQEGLVNDTVLGILEDEEGNLWLGTNRGLSRFDPRAETLWSFDLEHDLDGNVFFGGSCFRSASGEMFFGGTRGFTAFVPGHVALDPHPPPVVITDLRLFNEPAALARRDPQSPLSRSVGETEELVLSHRHNVFSFDFAALHFASPRENRYAYRLEAFDRDWVETAATRRSAHYSNLAPGRYRFRVKASNGDGVWNEEGASIAVVVLPPPWKTWWAYSLYLLAAMTVAGGYLRSHRQEIVRERSIAARERTINHELREIAELKDMLLADRALELEERERLIAELEAKNAELERFTYTVSHDLRSPLVTIKGFLGLLQRDAAAVTTDQVAKMRLEHDIDRIGTAADRMERLLGELLELSRIGRIVNPPEEVSLAELAREATELLAGPIAQSGATIEIADSLPVVSGDRIRLLEVMQNLIENGVKYMGDQPYPRIEVGIRGDGLEQCCTVRDNGIGIDSRYLEKIFGLFERLEADTEGTGVGLALVKRIIEVHGGRIWAESEGEEHGSTFCFVLPRGGGRQPEPEGS